LGARQENKKKKKRKNNTKGKKGKKKGKEEKKHTLFLHSLTRIEVLWEGVNPLE